jgi:hypothetical protein
VSIRSSIDFRGLSGRIAGDGVFSISQDGYIKLVDLKTNTTTNLVAAKDVKDVGIDSESDV